jgi:hypothetical protein
MAERRKMMVDPALWWRWKHARTEWLPYGAGSSVASGGKAIFKFSISISIFFFSLRCPFGM